MTDDARPVRMPAIFRAPGLEVRTELHRGTDADPDASVIKHVVAIGGGHSTRDVHIALARAEYQLRGVPEELRNVEITIDRHAQASIEAAKAKRDRKAKRAAEREAARAARAQRLEGERAAVEQALRDIGAADRGGA